MPHLHCHHGGAEPPASDLTAFTEALTETYTDVMETTSGHVAVTVETHSRAAMSLGRAEAGPMLVIDADIRRGRPLDQRRQFALAALSLAGEHFDVPDPNGKVVFTEHDGSDMMGVNRVGGEWDD
jgi:hypothetical protein